jgi:hypothetical protein
MHGVLSKPWMRRHPPPLALAVLAACAALTGAPGPVVAAPTISIRARTDIQLRAVRRRPDGRVDVTGAVVDRATAQGVGGLDVEVHIAGQRHGAVTSQDGTFSVVAPPLSGLVDVEIAFAGDDRFDPAALDERDIDPSRAPVDLTLEVSTTPLGALITAVARADAITVELPITFHITPADAGEPHLDLPARSGNPTMVKRADIFGAGAKRVRARFDGDAARGPAAAELTFELTSGTRVDLSLGGGTVAFEGTIHARGTVRDDDDLPVAGAAVTLVAGDRRLGAATTGSDGRYRVDAAADLLGTGRHSLQVVVESTERWRRGSRSGPAFIEIGVRRPAPVGITIAAFAATALVALGFVIGRRRPWRKPEPPPAPSAAQVEITGGLEPGRASLVSTLRRAHDHGFAGKVRDAVRARPLAGAELLLTLGDQVRRAVAADDGGFAVEELAVGEWQVRGAAAGHVSESFTLTIPHRGEMRGARVDLVPVREKIFTLYRRAALPVLPSPDLWGIWSPRQIVDHVRAATPPLRLAELTSFVEEAYFSGRVPDEALLPTAEAKVAAALAERAGAAL